MKRMLLAGFTAITVSFANTSFAAITLQSSDHNTCQHIDGHWLGTGTLTNWIIGECIYHGIGTIKLSDNSGNFVLSMYVEKVSGGHFCSQTATEHFSGICTNDIVTITTKYGELEGSFSERSGSAKGTLSIAPGISAKVDIQFQHID